MSDVRLVVFAYSDVGHACLTALLESRQNVVAVYTHEDKPGEKLWFPSVAKLARENGIPVVTTENLGTPDALSALAAWKPDLILSFYYRSLIPKAALDLARLGAFNMHGSLLPKYRGRAPINWAVLRGETETGMTLHVMTEKADAGDIVDQQAVPIGPDDTAAEVQARATQAAVMVLTRQISGLTSGRAPRRVQDVSKASYYGRRRPEDGEIHWDWPVRDVHNLVRAVSEPYPGAFTFFNGRKTVVWASRIAAPLRRLQSGQLLVIEDRLYTGCGDGGWLEIVRGQQEGGAPMSGAELAKKIFENAVEKEAGTQK